MKINKISQKILASVLMLAVLICGMFFLTACSIGGDDESISKLDKKLSELRTQLNEANQQMNKSNQQNQEAISDLESQLETLENQLNNANNQNPVNNDNNENEEVENNPENELIMANIKNSISKLNAKFSQASIPLRTTIEEERTLSSLGIEYEGNYSEIPNTFVCEHTGYLSPFQGFAVSTLIWLVNIDSFKIGKLYCIRYIYSNDEYALIDIDYEQNTLTLYTKQMGDLGVVCDETVIKFNQDFSNWENIVIKHDVENDTDCVLIAKNSATIEDSLDNLNMIVLESNNNTFKGFFGIDFDTNYYAMPEDLASISSTVKEYLNNEYVNNFNVKTNVNNALSGKFIYAELLF